MNSSSSTGPSGLSRLPAFAALQSRGFRLLWTGSLLSQTARWCEVAVLGWLVLELTNSPFQVAMVGFFRWAPLALLGVFSGILAERFDRRRILVIGSALSVLASATLTVLALTGLVQPWHVFALAFALGTYWALDFPARRALGRDFLEPERVVSAMSVETLAFTVSRIGGPIIGGGLISLIGVGGAYVAITAFYAAQLPVLLRLPRPVRRTAFSHGPILGDLMEGVRYARRNQIVLGVLVGSLLTNLLVFPVQQLFPVFARDVLGVGPVLLGLLLSAMGIGSLIGSATMASVARVPRPGAVFAAGCVAVLVAVILFSFSHWYAVSFALLVLAGVGQAAFSSLQSALILLGTSEEMRGRVLGLLVLAIGMQFLGFLIIGGLAAWIGTPLAVAASAGLGLLLMMVLIVGNKTMRT
ncbi:MAG: MFS transporter [Dehalococcoidia bacterium]|nr:MFS transporter [Dehalococcoidia bacterium]